MLRIRNAGFEELRKPPTFSWPAVWREYEETGLGVQELNPADTAAVASEGKRRQAKASEELHG